MWYSEFQKYCRKPVFKVPQWCMTKFGQEPELDFIYSILFKMRFQTIVLLQTMLHILVFNLINLIIFLTLNSKTTLLYIAFIKFHSICCLKN